MNPPDANPIEQYVARLADEDYDIQQSAAIELIEIGEPAVLPTLAALESENPQVRYLAAWVLGELGDERALKPLLKALNDPVERVQDWAAKSLAELGDTSIVPELIKLLEETHTRRHVALILGWLHDKRAVPALIQVLEDGHPEIRVRAADALARLGDLSATAALRAHINDPDRWVRARVIAALGELGGASEAAHILPLLDDHDEWVRANAAWTLGKINSRAALPELIRRLQVDGSPNVRRAVATALGFIGGDEAVEALVAALSDPEDMVLEAVDLALQKLGYAVDE